MYMYIYLHLHQRVFHTSKDSEVWGHPPEVMHHNATCTCNCWIWWFIINKLKWSQLLTMVACCLCIQTAPSQSRGCLSGEIFGTNLFREGISMIASIASNDRCLKLQYSLTLVKFKQISIHCINRSTCTYYTEVLVLGNKTLPGILLQYMYLLLCMFLLMYLHVTYMFTTRCIACSIVGVAVPGLFRCGELGKYYRS